jgi:hypothetical protein
MASQQYATAPSRNPAVAAEGFGSGAKPGKVSTPTGPVSGKAPATGTGTASGSSVKGFGGGLIEGKVRC